MKLILNSFILFLLMILNVACSHYRTITYFETTDDLVPQGAELTLVDNVEGNIANEISSLMPTFWEGRSWLTIIPRPELKNISSHEVSKILKSQEKKQNSINMPQYVLEIEKLNVMETHSEITVQQDGKEQFKLKEKVNLIAKVELWEPRIQERKVERVFDVNVEQEKDLWPSAPPGRKSLRPIVSNLLGFSSYKEFEKENARDEIKGLTLRNAKRQLSESIISWISPVQKTIVLRLDRQAPSYDEFKKIIKKQKYLEAINYNFNLSKHQDYWRALKNSAIIYEEIGDALNAKLSYEECAKYFQGTDDERRKLDIHLINFGQRYSSAVRMQQRSAQLANY